MEKLKKQYEQVCQSYVNAMLEMWDFKKKENINCYWIGNVDGVFSVNDTCYLNMEEIRYIVDKEISYETIADWQDYNRRCFVIGLDKTELKSWCNDAPRYKLSTISKLEEKTKELRDMIEWAEQEHTKDLKQN